MLKPTETSKKVKFLRKKNLQKFKFLEKTAKISSNLIVLFKFFVASDLIETIYVRMEPKIEFKIIQNIEKSLGLFQNFQRKKIEIR